jgi:mannose-6-phosphate isomerase-like protein (cupin superfamily)
MEILHSDRVAVVPTGQSPNYNQKNSLISLMNALEQVQLACDREWYLRDDLQYLFPFETLELYGPQGDDCNVTDPGEQNNKTDFQKQNVKDFTLSSTILARGWVTTGTWTGPFLRLCYAAGPDSPLWQINHGDPGPDIRLWLRVNDRTAPAPLVVPYNDTSDLYTIELWGYTGEDLRGILRGSSRDALDRGELQVRTDLLSGNPSDFDHDKVVDRDMRQVSPDCTMHPILPLHIECAWGEKSLKNWDSNGGANYHYEFSMVLRGWDHFLATGMSANPHGGVGFLDYRNLLSNYGRFAGSNELGRALFPWNFNAFGRKDHGNGNEPFLAVDYMDLHIVRPECGIGLHRHRDNQEAFLMLEGRGYMVVGDWCKIPQRERCFEIRTLRPGHLAMLKGGNLHGLVNATDEQILLFMFGGYD